MTKIDINFQLYTQETVMKQKIILSALLAFTLSSTVALAHHSFAMFDASKRVKLEGKVKEFQWTNPHAWLQVMAPNDKGVMVEWSLELGSPNMLARSGVKKNSFVPGDKVAIEMSPMRDGSNGGSMTSATFADGKVIKFTFGGNNAQISQ
jgi:Family of unknown function (DUF6152)